MGTWALPALPRVASYHFKLRHYPKSGSILEAVLYRGELPRAEVASLLGASPRHARRVTAALLDREVLVSPSSRTALRLAFPAKLASCWLPGLFPEQAP